MAVKKLGRPRKDRPPRGPFNATIDLSIIRLAEELCEKHQCSRADLLQELISEFYHRTCPANPTEKED